jgi:hypothetical protein
VTYQKPRIASCYRSFFLYNLGYVLYHRDLWKSRRGGVLAYWLFLFAPFLCAALLAPMQLVLGIAYQTADLQTRAELGVSREEYADLYFPKALADELLTKAGKNRTKQFDVKLERFMQNEEIGSLPKEPQHRRVAEENPVRRRVAPRRVDRQHRDLDRLARLGVVGQLHLVGRVETGNRAAAII